MNIMRRVSGIVAMRVGVWGRDLQIDVRTLRDLTYHRSCLWLFISCPMLPPPPQEQLATKYEVRALHTELPQQPQEQTQSVYINKMLFCASDWLWSFQTI